MSDRRSTRRPRWRRRGVARTTSCRNQGHYGGQCPVARGS